MRIPENIVFQTKPQIAFDQIRQACEAGLPRGVVLMDAGYGANTDLRTDIAALGLTYVAGIMPNTTELALGLPAKAWRTIAWREGSAEKLTSRFARLRVRVAHRDYNLTTSRPEEWLLIEWPKNETEPAKYWLSTVPEKIAFSRLVDLTKLRWRIERDYQDLKQEVGLGHFEGRGWRGFHHHATLCIAAYGFLISERETIPPSAPRSAVPFQAPDLPDGYRPRGSAAASQTAHSKLDCDHAPTTHPHPRQTPATMSVLRRSHRASSTAQTFMTQ